MKVYFKLYLLSGLMIFAALISVLLKPSHKLADKQEKIELISMIPKEFADWRMDESIPAVVPSPDVKQLLDKIYDQSLSRTYINSRNERVMLTISYGSEQSQDLKAHRQEVCYRSQGFLISNLRNSEINILNHKIIVTQMFASKTNRLEPVTYWFTMGSNIVLTPYERLIVQFKYALEGIIPDGFLIRISTLQPDSPEAFELHQKFITELIKNIDIKYQDRLLGQFAS